MKEVRSFRDAPLIWPWIMGLLTLAVCVWAFGEWIRRGAEQPPDGSAATSEVSVSTVIPLARGAGGA